MGYKLNGVGDKYDQDYQDYVWEILSENGHVQDWATQSRRQAAGQRPTRKVLTIVFHICLLTNNKYKYKIQIRCEGKYDTNGLQLCTPWITSLYNNKYNW